MFKIIISFLFCISCFVCFSQDTISITNRVITVYGESEKIIAPNYYYLIIEANGNQIDPTTSDTLSRAEIVKRLEKIAELNGGNANDIGLNHSFIDNHNIFHGSFTIKMTKFKNINSIIDKLTTQGFTIKTLSKFFDSDEKIKPDLFEIALKEARFKAIAALTSINQRLGKVLKIEEQRRSFNSEHILLADFSQKLTGKTQISPIVFTNPLEIDEGKKYTMQVIVTFQIEEL
jgi:hypothetical protein